MERTKQWYVVYTRAGQEHKVCNSLRRKKIDSFYPVNRMIKTSYGRERILFKPLLERFVFVSIASDQLDEVKKVSGIANFVHWLSQPVAINDKDILLMKRFCDTHEDIQPEKTMVTSSEPAYISAHLTDQDTELVNLHFPVIGYNMIAEESKTRVKVITIDDYHSKTEARKSQYAETR